MKLSCTTKLKPNIRRHVIGVAKFTVNTLFTKRQLDKLQSISIRVDKTMVGSQIHDEAISLGYMDIAYDDEHDRPCNFIIWIHPNFTKKTLSKLGGTTLMETIIHEIVHIKQALTGEMKQVNRNGKMMIKFHKKYYDVNSKMGYWLYPWEIEARGHEKGVLNLYCKENNCFQEFPDKPIM